MLKLFQSTPEQKPSPILGNEISYAGSSYFDDWNLRPYNPAELYQKRGSYSLFDDMREDDQICAVLTLKKIMILNSDWLIECENDEAIDFLTDNLSNYIDGLFNKKLFEILSAMDFGFSITEKIFNYSDTDYGKKIILEKLKTRPPHTFDIHTDEYGNISKLIQHAPNNNEFELDPKKFIIYSYNKEFDNPYGTSELNRGVYRAWVSKIALMKMWNIYLERFGMPLHVGTIPRSAGESEKIKFKAMLANIQSKTGVTLPPEFALDLKEATKGTGEYEKAINKYDTQIARKMLIPDLLGLSGGETGGGSYALGKEQFNIFYTTINYIRNDIERMVNNEIINPLVLWNYGNKYSAKFKFNQINEEQKKNDLTLWLESVKSGKIPVYGKQINWFLEQVNAPVLDDDELNILDEQRTQMREALTNGIQNGNQSGNQEDQAGNQEKQKPEEIKKPEDKKAGPVKEFKADRALTKYERRTDFAMIRKQFDDMYFKYAPEFNKAYALVINAAIDDIRRRKIIENKRLELVNQIKLKHLNKTKMLWKNLLRETYDMAATDPKKFAINQPTGLNDEDIAEWFEQSADYINLSESDEIIKKMRGAMAESIKRGDGIREAVINLEIALGPWEVYKLAEGNNQEPETRITRNIRTNITKAYNESRKQEFEALPDDEIVGYQFSAILDERTSDICESLDGTYFTPAELSLYNPPLHWNCRSLVMPIFKDDEFNWSDEEVVESPDIVADGNGFYQLAEGK